MGQRVSIYLLFDWGKLYLNLQAKSLYFDSFRRISVFQASFKAVRSDFRASRCHISEFKVINLGVTIKRQSMATSSEDGKSKGNRLLKERSPYLLQHAYNPVDW